MSTTPIQIDPNPGDRFGATTIEAAQSNTRYGVQAEVNKYNAAKIADYDVQWSKYVESRDARPDATNILAPVPAYAEIVMVDERGWPYITPSDIYVVKPRTYVPSVKTKIDWFTPGVALPVDPFNVAVLERVKYKSMEFMRIA